ncbi:hypothetical protein GCM10010977_03460 [Citricoccus zhacaiensis]|uniref:DUF4190 domain-containing protein n=1 Tax=Citricoccus zhacaiensis TaxID=489142 RepID=A0ABQ2LN34_9MICC|nr:hypothetical protein [Citricoccus zhacaiensis]GGO40719.1 hypothetical protein GCM10010977_03460 [Citricoccus zhacaiensis]
MSYEQPAPYPPAGPMPPARRTNGVGIAALVVGIIAILLSLIPIVGIIVAVVAVVLGIIGLVLKNRARGMAITGLILGAVALVVGVIVTIVAGVFVSEMDRQMNQENAIEYRATVSAGAATVSYGSVSGQSTAEFEGEWTESLNVTGFDIPSLMVSGDILGEDQELTCEIIVNGETVSSQSGTSTVSCSGSTID